jgi:hypothetical protein
MFKPSVVYGTTVLSGSASGDEERHRYIRLMETLDYIRSKCPSGMEYIASVDDHEGWLTAEIVIDKKSAELFGQLFEVIKEAWFIVGNEPPDNVTIKTVPST